MVEKYELLLQVLIPVVGVFLLILIIVLYLLKKERRENRLTKLDNAVLRMGKFPEELNLYKVFEIYLDISYLGKQEIFAKFFDEAIRIVAKNINAQESFMHLDKFFENWASYRADGVMIIIHRGVALETRDRVRELARVVWESTKDEKNSQIRIAKFKNLIDKPYYEKVFELMPHFYNDFDELETLEKQKNAPKRD